MSARFIAIILCLMGSLAFGQSIPYERFKPGDLLFQNLDCGELCDAIERVTTGHQGMDFSHVGIIVKQGDSLMVEEAYGKTVHLTPLNEFFSRVLDESGTPKVIGARVLNTYSAIAKKAALDALTYLDRPYDDKFLPVPDALYCSELIYFAFKDANKGSDFFPMEGMTYKDPSTGQTMEVWKNYFAKLNMAVPEGELGCNPGGLSRSDKLEIIFDGVEFLRNFSPER